MLTIVQAALEAGFLYAPIALALFLSFSILNIADMTTDGAFVLGSAVSAMMCLAGHPILALPAGMAASAAAGFITAFLQTKLAVPSILAGIVTNIGLYSINLMVMGKSNQSLSPTDAIYTMAKDAGFAGSWYELAVTAIIVLALCALLVLFLGTRLGLSIRATGDNADMVRASSINPNFTITVGLCVANAMTGLSGAMVAQYSTFANVNSGTGMVVLALAALVIGETLIGKGSMTRRVLGVVAGSIIYRFIYAAALRFNVPADYMKLVSAVIVGVAIAAPAVRRWAAFQMQKRRALAGRRGE